MLNIKIDVSVSTSEYEELFWFYREKRRITSLDLLKHALQNNRKPAEIKQLQANYALYNRIIDQLTVAKEKAVKKGRVAK